MRAATTIRRTRSLSFIGLAFVLLSIGCTWPQWLERQSTAAAPDHWRSVEALAEEGLYASALARTDSLLQLAEQQGEPLERFRGLMYRGRFQQLTGTPRSTVIQELEGYLASERPATPLRQLVHSALAEAYWAQYSDQRWTVLERGETATDGEDMATWGQASYMRRIIAHHRAALEPFDSLRAIPSNDLGTVLRFVPETDSIARQREGLALRPTLFDLLAHRALNVFTNSETRLAEPAHRFQLNDPAHFGLYEDFAYLPLQHPDTGAWEFQSLRIFQQLVLLRLRDDDPGAFVDLDLKRLAYVHANSSLPKRDSLYLQALEVWLTRCSEHTAWARVQHAIAEQLAAIGERHEPLVGDQWKWEKKRAVEHCNEAIERFPGSTGAGLCAQLKERLERPHLELQAEAAVTPMKGFRVSLAYRHVRRVHLRVIPLESRLSRPWQNDRDALRELLGQRAQLEWHLDLPDDGDLQRHVLEIPLAGLPAGEYALLVSGGPEFDPQKEAVAWSHFWATRISFAERTTPEGRVRLLLLDREHGKPLQNATVQMHGGRYTDGRMSWNVITEARSDTDGEVLIDIGEHSGSRVWEITHDGARYISPQRHLYARGTDRDSDVMRTFLFTDRAIYRPGQQLHWKGIVTRRGQSRGDVNVVAGHATTVYLYDPFGQAQDSLKVTSDAFGAFKGTFSVPATALGNFVIRERNGTCHIRVEEYQRPTFSVELSTPAPSPKPGDTATVQGQATTYTALPVSEARVEWRVMRSTRWPWWFRGGGMPWRPPIEVARGSTRTGPEGELSLSFHATPDPALTDAKGVVHTFTVEVDVTSLAGETRSATTQLNVAEQNIDILIDAGEALDRSRDDSLRISITDLQGQVLDRPMDVRITRLSPPWGDGPPPKKRAWERPDRFLLDFEQHVQRLPDELHADEDVPANWSEAEITLERRDWRSQGRAFPLSGISAWDVGMYRVEVGSSDAEGFELKAVHHVVVKDPSVQLSGAVHESFSAQVLNASVEPGDKAVLLLGTTLPEARVLVEVERPAPDGSANFLAVRRPIRLEGGQQRLEVPIMEGDRGGVFFHMICVERGQVHRQSLFVDVPWSNKELQVEWMSFRDKLLPGAQDTWRLRIQGPDGAPERVAAQVLATMYDASLDQFTPHDIRIHLRGSARAQHGWDLVAPFRSQHGRRLSPAPKDLGVKPITRPWLDTYRFAEPLELMMYQKGLVGGEDTAVPMAMAMDKGDEIEEVFHAQAVALEAPPSEEAALPMESMPRRDFRETAFFMPDLITDADGSISLAFTMPEALTRWKLIGLAHTTDMKTARFEREVITSKPMMVMPRLPRALRAGDRITLGSTVDVREGGEIEGLARLQLFDPRTGLSVDTAFGHQGLAQTFLAAPGQSATVDWELHVPQGMDAVTVRLTASGGQRPGPMGVPGMELADGEEHVLPILSDKVLLTESLPLFVRKAGTHEFRMERLAGASGDEPPEHRSLTLDFSPEPAWQAVLALPYLMEFPHECTEQIFGRYLANRLAAHLVENRPAIAEFLAQADDGDGSGFLGELEKYPELRRTLLEETPWVLRARDEGERRRRLHKLLDPERVADEAYASLRRLEQLQLANGSWPWFAGMRPSRRITQYVVAGAGRLEALGAADLRSDGTMQTMLRNAIDWMDREAQRIHRERAQQATTTDGEVYRPGHDEIQYLLARSYFPRWPIAVGSRPAADAIRNALRDQWTTFGLQEQAMIALALLRHGDRSTADGIRRSLLERATRSDELGMYWKGHRPGTEWGSFPTETHAVMIELFQEVSGDKEVVEQLKQHLLVIKRGTDWGTTKATAEALHAILSGGPEIEAENAIPLVEVGGRPVVPDKQEKATGRFLQSWPADAIRPEMGTVRVTTATDGMVWGALHWSYLEQLDHVTPAAGPLQLERTLFLEHATGDGRRLVPLDAQARPRPGDRIVVRIIIKSDRWLDFVHLKDQRAAGTASVEVLSGPDRQGQLGHYRAVRDAATHFFFDRISPGTHVIEHALRVTHEGDMGHGIATIECMYAPEFEAHSASARMVVPGDR